MCTSRTASSAALEAMARTSVLELKRSEVAAVSRFMTAFSGLGSDSRRHASW
uniref:Uncharacterized protein n=1 Tax=Anguilla anguilla TaxID=7936 RepID=A0A0E9WDV9_ANGAN